MVGSDTSAIVLSVFEMVQYIHLKLLKSHFCGFELYLYGSVFLIISYFL